MGFVNILLAILLIISAIALVITVLFQTGGKSSKLSTTIAGGSSDNYIGKNKQRAKDKKLSRFTMIIAIVFVVIVFATAMVTNYQQNTKKPAETTGATTTAVATGDDTAAATDADTAVATDAATEAATDAATEAPAEDTAE